jgi:hypothetical protein
MKQIEKEFGAIPFGKTNQDPSAKRENQTNLWGVVAHKLMT